MHRPSSIARRQTRSVRLLLPGIVTLASLGCIASEGSTQTGSTGGSGATATSLAKAGMELAAAPAKPPAAPVAPRQRAVRQRPEVRRHAAA